MGIEKWSTSAGSNNMAPPDGWPGGMLPSQVEPTGRQMMASLASWYQAAEWINYNNPIVYISATQFSIATNVTTTFHVGRRVQATDGSTSVFGMITASAFTSLTTVTVVWDTGVLQTGVTIVYVGITSAVNTSAPALGSSAFANPSDTIGLTAVNGSATTAMRSDAAPALSQGITPTWTNLHTFAATRGLALVRAGSTSALWQDTAAATDTGKYEITTSATNFVLRSLNDAENATGNILVTTRAGVSISDISVGNATSNPTFTFLGTGAGTVSGAWAFGGANTFSALNTFSASRGIALQRAGNTSPLYWNTAAAADTGKYEITTGGTNFVLRTLNDAENATGNILVTTRSGVSLSDLSFGNVTSNPTYTFLGTGTASFSGKVMGNDGTSLFELGYKDTPLNTQGSNYTAVVADRGKCINASASITVTIPSAVFSAGAVLTVSVGNGATVTIAQGSGLTLQWAGNGATTGSRTLTGAGLATILFLTASAALISGAGLS